MSALKKAKPMLDYLVKSSPATSKAILKTISHEEVQLFGEICSNLLAGAIKISTANKTLLADHAEVIRKLARREIKPTTRQRLLIKNSEAVVILIKTLYSKLYPKNGST